MLTTETLVPGTTVVDPQMLVCSISRSYEQDGAILVDVTYEGGDELTWSIADLFTTVWTVDMLGSTKDCWLTCWDGPRTAHYTNEQAAQRRLATLQEASPSRSYRIIEQDVTEAWWLTPQA